MLLLTLAIRFANLLLASLVTGAMFGIWLAFNPKGLDAPTYVALQQQGIRGLNTAMPVLGLAAVLTTLAAAFLMQASRSQQVLLILAAAGFLAAGLITRFLNQPINAVVMTWSAASPPPVWTALRDAWWRWHVARLSFGLVGLCLLILAELLRVTKAG
jgi:Domain of unknown function (DUF1772)